jgi:DNA replication protein DnaC
MALREAQLFLAEMEAGKPGRWLTLTGKQGVGKTFLARQILERSKLSNPGRVSLWSPLGASGTMQDRDRRPYCIWLDATRMAERMRGGEYDLPESFGPDWCLVVDDIGTARDRTDFLAEGLYRLANSRLGKWTVFTSNLGLQEIAERIDPRFASRLIRDENRIVTITAPDYALRRK